jgi:nucleoid-associated protein YgaU
MHFARSLGTSFGHQLPMAGAVLALSLGVACGGGAPAQPTPTSGAAQPGIPTVPPRPALTSPVSSPSPLASPGAGAGATTYTVEPGDSLQSIADRFYGDPTQWQRIYDANRDAIGPSADQLKTGTQLKIPPKE